MVNGATSTGTFSLNDNAKSTDAVGASVDFEIMDSPRNATSSVGANSMKAMKGSTIVKSDYVDSPVNNATSDFGSLNNLNLVKVRASIYLCY